MILKPIRRILAILLSFAALSQAAEAQNVIFVSEGAAPGGDGSLSSPLNSISDAITSCAGRTGSTTIYLRGGTYRLREPLTIGPEHANASHSLTISSFPGEKAIISGSEVIPVKWKRHKGGILKSKVSVTKDPDLLFGDGRLLVMARYPDYDSTAVRFNGTSAEATSPTRVLSWKKPEGGYLHAMHAHDWGDFHYMITGRNPDGTLILEGGWQNNRPLGLHKDNRMVENIFEELDCPGEWFHDKDSGTLYYYPLPGEDPTGMTFESPVLENLVTVKGSGDSPVRNLTLRDLSFRHTRRTFMNEYEPLLRSDWTIHRDGAIFLEGTEDCRVEDCDITDVGGNGVFISKFNRRSGVEGCLLTRIGASAICFVGDPSCVRSPSFRYENYVPWEEMDFAKGPKGDNFPAECYSSDNLISEIGLFEKQVTGVEISMSFRITVSHNTIHDTPRAGINISEGTWGGHIIEYNDVFNTVKETGDHGSFNSWGRDRYWHPDYGTMAARAAERPEVILADMLEPNILRYNRFRCDRGWDIDLDDGSSYYVIHDNLCLNGGIKLREGFYRRVENNIIVNNTLHSHVWFEDSGDVFTRNIVMTPYQPIGENVKGLDIDRNIFADSLSLGKAVEMGLDSLSIVAPLEFADPQNGIFTLPDDSEAIRLGGFKNIPMDRFGVTSPRLKAIASTPVMTIPKLPEYAGGDNAWYWKNDGNKE